MVRINKDIVEEYRCRINTNSSSDIYTTAVKEYQCPIVA